MAAATLNRPFVDESFRALARLEGWTDDDIEILAKYSAALEANDAPVIFDANHLSKLLGLETNFLYAISNAPERFYRKFEIPKRNGKFREINEPLPTLKMAQRYLLDNIFSRINLSPASKAFALKSNIKRNARLHLRQDFILKLDIENFFPSIKMHRVYAMVYEIGYTKPLSMLLARMCTLNNSLPQGAPTSPALANIICREMDDELLSYCRARSLRFTRYADDITVSGEKITKFEIRDVRSIIKKHDFNLNEKKTSLLRNGAKKIVTGIVVNEKMQAPRELRREFRKTMFFIRKFGIDGHVEKIDCGRRNYLDHLIGVGGFIYWAGGRKSEAVRADLQLLHELKRKRTLRMD
jgi:RNA-directed DNA polymerase